MFEAKILYVIETLKTKYYVWDILYSKHLYDRFDKSDFFCFILFLSCLELSS